MSQPEDPREISSGDYTSMEPKKTVTPSLSSDSCLTATKEIPQEVTSTSQISFSEIQKLDLINFNPDPGSSYLTPLPEDLVQLQYRDEITQKDRQRQWERSALPQRKRSFMEHIRQKTLNHMAPYRVEREGKTLYSHNKDQSRCKCHYYQIGREETASNTNGKDPAFWKMLVQGFNQMTLSPDAIQAGRLQEDLPPDQ